MSVAQYVIFFGEEKGERYALDFLAFAYLPISTVDILSVQPDLVGHGGDVFVYDFVIARGGQ
ncbi:MAG: hypothetical protein K2M95_05580, partial [Clostridiales bacterium]|nr:hypothetical protein [Clostridiales bacterium]